MKERNGGASMWTQATWLQSPDFWSFRLQQYTWWGSCLAAADNDRRHPVPSMSRNHDTAHTDTAPVSEICVVILFPSILNFILFFSCLFFSSSHPGDFLGSSGLLFLERKDDKRLDESFRRKWSFHHIHKVVSQELHLPRYLVVYQNKSSCLEKVISIR